MVYGDGAILYCQYQSQRERGRRQVGTEKEKIIIYCLYLE
jgi:hypothetical protein